MKVNPPTMPEIGSAAAVASSQGERARRLAGVLAALPASLTTSASSGDVISNLNTVVQTFRTYEP